MYPQADRQRVLVRDLGDGSAVRVVVVPEAEQRQHRRPVVGVVGPHAVVVTEVLDPRADIAGPCGRDLVLDVAVVPGEARVRPRRNEGTFGLSRAVPAAGREEEPVRIGERRECRRPERVRRDHVQRLHLGLVGERDHDVLLVDPGVRVQPVQLGHLPLEVPRHRVGLGRVARDVDVRGVVRVDREVGRVAVLRADHAAQVAVDLADRTAGVVARDRDAVALRVVRGRAREVVALVDGEQEQRVRLVDPVRGEPVEELLESHVVVVQLLDVAGLARRVREVDVPGVPVPVVGIRDVPVGDGDPGLLHLRDEGQRDRRLHPVEAREADVVVLILDQVAVQVRHRPGRLDDRIDVLRAHQRVEAVVTARLVRQEVRMGMRGRSADRRGLGAVDADADVVRERLRRGCARVVAGGLDRLGRPRPEERRDVDAGVLEDRVGGRDLADVTPVPRVRDPRRRGDDPVLVDHLGREVGLPGRRERRAGRVVDRRRPVGERDPGAGRSGRREVAEAVRDGLPHPVGVDARQRRENPRRRVRDQDGVVVREQRAVAADEVEQVRHLLEIRRDVAAVPQEMRVVELNRDDVLDAVREVAVAAGRRRRAAGRGLHRAEAQDRDRRQTCDGEHGEDAPCSPLQCALLRSPVLLQANLQDGY